MYAKIQISGKIEVKTGMHIGGNGSFSPIGAADSPVVRDGKSNLPIIPGSSLKGKMRTLLAKSYNDGIKEPNNDHERILRVFGGSKKGAIKRSRVLVSDMIMSNVEELRKMGLQSTTEVKFENTINRATAEANPRQIERVVRGAEFDLDIIYELEKEDEFMDDMKLLANGFKLLQYDYLGGNGSRGYGKIVFKDLDATCVVGEVNKELMEEAKKILNN